MNEKLDLEALLRLHGATTADWRMRRHGVVVGGPFHEYTKGSAQGQLAMFSIHESIDPDQRDANATFAVAMHAALPALIERIRELEADRNSWAEQASQRVKDCVEIESRASNAGGAVAAGHFVKRSRFGPWIEIDPAKEKGGTPLYTHPAPRLKEPVADELRDALAMVKGDRDRLGRLLEHAQAEQPAAAPIAILADDHTGMRVDYRGMFRQARDALRRAPSQSEMLRQLEGHLEELGRRWYAGDIAVVDELLQLYCVERGAREARKAHESNAPRAEDALLDACRTAALALAHASRENPVYDDAYMAVSKAIDAATSRNREARDAG